jgi:hypothetical protein
MIDMCQGFVGVTRDGEGVIWDETRTRESGYIFLFNDLGLQHNIFIGKPYKYFGKPQIPSITYLSLGPQTNYTQ